MATPVRSLGEIGTFACPEPAGPGIVEADGRGEGADLGAPRRPRRGRAARPRPGARAPVRRHRAPGRGAGVVDGSRASAPPSAPHRARTPTGQPRTPVPGYVADPNG